MDDIRALQREKWQKEKERKEKEVAEGSSPSAASGAGDSSPYTASPAPTAPFVSNTPGASSSQAASSPTPAAAAAVPASVSQSLQETASGEPTKIRRVHILPIGPSADSSGQPRLQLLSSELRRMRTEQVKLRSGQFVNCNEHEFVIVKAEPDDGVLNQDTDYFVDGDFVLRFNKVQFICLKDFQGPVATEDPTALFAEYISPYFKSIADSDAGIGNVVTVGESVKIFNSSGQEKDFKVIAAEPSEREIGIIDKDTMVFVDWDSTPEFEKIHIVPFQDTLPGAYDFDIFNDYLKPYLTRNKHLYLSANDQFTYQGVQFKVVCCEPNGPARIGRSTTIYCEGQLHPSLRNLLPPELLEQLSHLPPGLQMLLMNSEALAGGYEERLIEVQEMLSRRRGLSNETINQVDKFRWGEEGHTQTDQTQCMICLSDFTDGEEVRGLPCNHVFHAPCVDEWLRRCTDCPICKANIDRAVRQY